MKRTLVAVTVIVCLLFISACATVNLTKRENTFTLPKSSPNLARVYILAGSVKLKGGILYHPDPIDMKEGGDVYIDNNKIGYFYRDEIIAVDLKPGEYLINWITKLGEFDVSHTKSIPYKLIVNKGDVKYLVANKDQRGSSSAMFGAIGALADSELFHSYFIEKNNKNILKNKRIVSYIKM